MGRTEQGRNMRARETYGKPERGEGVREHAGGKPLKEWGGTQTKCKNHEKLSIMIDKKGGRKHPNKSLVFSK